MHIRWRTPLSVLLDNFAVTESVVLFVLGCYVGHLLALLLSFVAVLLQDRQPILLSLPLLFSTTSYLLSFVFLYTLSSATLLGFGNLHL